MRSSKSGSSPVSRSWVSISRSIEPRPWSRTTRSRGSSRLPAPRRRRDRAWRRRRRRVARLAERSPAPRPPRSSSRQRSSARARRPAFENGARTLSPPWRRPKQARPGPIRQKLATYGMETDSLRANTRSPRKGIRDSAHDRIAHQNVKTFPPAWRLKVTPSDTWWANVSSTWKGGREGSGNNPSHISGEVACGGGRHPGRCPHTSTRKGRRRRRPR
jgi:hypothetical protein